MDFKILKYISVCLVQLIKRRAEQTKVKLLVFWSVKLHLAMDLTIQRYDFVVKQTNKQCYINLNIREL